MADFYNDPVGFIFGGNTGLSYSDLQRRRQIAIALASRARKFPTNLGEGLTYFGEALGDTIQDRRLAAAEGQYKAGEDARERGITPSTYIPPANAYPSVTGATPSPAAPAGAPAGTAANPITAPPTIPSSMLDPRSIETQPPAVDSVPAIRPVPTVAPAPRAAREPPPNIKAIIDARVPEAMRPYYYRMAEKESSYRPDTTSTTGAAGLFQFTRGTGRQYGIAGDARYDPAANTDAAVRFTEDNANTLRRSLGREPSWSELALAHQQGAGTAAKMLTGTGNAPDYNLQVNRAGGLGPQAAAQKIMAYYGMPGGAGAPAGSRDAIAAAMTPPPSGPPTPQELASQELLQETVGVGGGGPSFPPTASAGRAGVSSDAPSPGASPLGAVTDPSIGDTLQRQRGGGVGGIMPPAQPTVLPQVAQVRARSVPVTASDAAMGALPGSVAPPAGFGAAAPAARAPAALPSDDETIPPDLSDRPYPRRFKAPPREATVYGPDEAMQRDMRIMNSDVSPLEQQRAQARLGQAKAFMDLKNAREQERYKNEREAYEAEDKAAAEWQHKAPERKLETRLKQLETQKAIADRKNDPVTALQLQATLEKTREELAKARFEAGRPRELGLEEKELDVAKKRDEAAARKQVEGGPPNIEITAEQGNTLSHFTKASLARDQYNRIPDADKILAEGLKDELVGKLPFFGNAALSNKYRVVRNAAQNLIQAHLRDTSGAAIGAQEMLTHHAALVPIYGDDPVTMRNKAQQREGVVSGMYLSLGKARPLADYEIAKRTKADAEEQEKIKAEMPKEPKVGVIYKNEKGRRRYWTGSRWEDD